MSHTLQPMLQCLEGHFDCKAKHHFSVIIEVDGKFYELNPSYFKKYPASWVDEFRLWVRKKKRTVKDTSEKQARQILDRSLTSYDDVCYTMTVSHVASAHQQHVTIVQIPSLYLDALIAARHLRPLPVDRTLSRMEQARSAVLGLSVVTALMEPVSTEQRLVATN